MVKPNTPVIIGVGEYSERLNDSNYQAMSHVQLAVAAGKQALNDALSADALTPHIDTIAAVRTFEDTSVALSGPFGKSNNFPGSIARHLNISPKRCVLEVAGGQSPQHLVNEFCEEIAAGNASMVLLAGAEAISTVRHLVTQQQNADWSETLDEAFEDRGAGIGNINTRYQMAHGLTAAPPSYALAENARRARLGLSRNDYIDHMAQLFASFTPVAADNPHSMAKEIYSAEQLATINEDNRMIADPYPRRMVARDQVNQGAAVLLTSFGKARELGIDEHKMVFLHGYTDLSEKSLIERPDLGASPAAQLASRKALEYAGISADELSCIDLYSCFPIAVLNVCDSLGLKIDDPRGLTVTGGLPYFGGAGNNYSMHAICSTAQRLRHQPGSFGFVGANGGTLSKYSVGIYSTTPTEFKVCDSAELQSQLNQQPGARVSVNAKGVGVIDSFTVIYKKGAPSQAVIIGSLKDSSERFFATPEIDDTETLQRLLSEREPVGMTIYVEPTPRGNRFAFDKASLTQRFPKHAPALRESYEFCQVKQEGHLLQVTINRPESRNCLHPPAHLELESIFDAYYADSSLWVCILTGAGSEAFCAGNDLKYSASGKPVYMPLSGFAGLTSRKTRNKPVIAAVNGHAMGGGLEICLACDIVVADETARFALSEVKVGVIAAMGGLVRLPRQLPEKIASDMVLTGRSIDVDTALHYGLVSRKASAGQALATARQVAEEVLQASPTSVRLSLEYMNEAKDFASESEAIAHDYPQLDELINSHDMLEGIMAFSQKRKPNWKNH